jgi:aminoglycoside phosphotransferase (APT) family kinase protein
VNNLIPPHVATLIPGCEEGGEPKLVQALPGGRGCNVVLRVDTDAGRFVLRQRQPPLDRPGSAAMTELRCQMAAAAAGLAPRVIQAAMDGSWLLMDYIDAPTWTEQQLISDAGVEQLGLCLAQLHRLPAPQGVPLLDANGIAAGYLRQLAERDPGEALRHRHLMEEVRGLSQAIANLALPAVLNHGDLQPGNMLGSGPVLVDWEYAQLVDPTYDIACVLTYYPSLESRLSRLLDCAGLTLPAFRLALPLQRARFACLNQLWNAVNTPKAG